MTTLQTLKHLLNMSICMLYVPTLLSGFHL